MGKTSIKIRAENLAQIVGAKIHSNGNSYTVTHQGVDGKMVTEMYSTIKEVVAYMRGLYRGRQTPGMYYAPAEVEDDPLWSTAEYTKEFERFWEQYPRKTGKRAAFDEWRRTLATRGGDPETLIKAAKHYREECEAEGREERYILHARTFLGQQRRWEDYIEPRQPSSPRQPKGRNVLQTGTNYGAILGGMMAKGQP